ncbi:MAG TPA: type II toxin-antitoxin system RelE/ParE family toxin [Arenicellales bacterium]|nr:type II toxin-antitoxin system RelE/ParE family toxin [Arenicellales bacterium]
MRLVWTRRARADLEEIFDYILQDNPTVASSVLDRIGEASLSLVEHPGMGRPGRVAGTRELVVAGLPWILPYTAHPDAVVILRVLHAARQWPGDFDQGDHPA